MSKSTRYKLLLSGVCAAALFAAAPSARADVITSSLSVGNDAISPFPGPYGSVLINRTSTTTAVITFTAAAGYRFGDGSAFDLNVNSANFTISAPVLTGPNSPACSNCGQIDTGSGIQVDGMGRFNLVNDLETGMGGALARGADIASFTLTNLSGTWASVSDVLAFNLAGFDAAAHIFVCSTPACTGGAVQTGFAGEPRTTTVPEPTSLALLGGSLAAAGLLLRRRKRTGMAEAA